jgi:peroxiredoxin family protein
VVGVVNTTIKNQAIAINYEARVFFEFKGITGLDKINPKDLD